MSNTKVIYTALTNGYDDLRQPETVRPDYDYICFSNDLGDADIGVWKIRTIPYDNPSGTRLTRYPKLNPHLVLPEYIYSIWVDANVRIDETLYLRADELLDDGTVCALSAHGKRTNVYQEADALLLQGFGEPWLVYKQAKYMLEQGFTKPSRLLVCSLIFRQHMDPRVVAFSHSWWEQYCRFSCRDQMSVNYALALAGLDATPFLPPETLLGLTRHHLHKRVAGRHAGSISHLWFLLSRAPQRVWRIILRVVLRRIYLRHAIHLSPH